MDDPSRRNIILAIPAIVAFRSLMRVKVFSPLIEPIGEMIIHHPLNETEKSMFAQIIEACRSSRGFHESMLQDFVSRKTLGNGAKSTHLDLAGMHEAMIERSKRIELSMTELLGS